MIAIALSMVLSAAPQSRGGVPVTIEVAQDVEVKPYSELRQPDGSYLRQTRGTLYIAPKFKGFRIEKGRTFQMVKMLGEGGCRIRVEKREYDLGSCPWLEGFTDRQADIFRIVAGR